MWSPLYPIRSRSVFGEKVDVVPVTVTGILFQRNRFEFCRVQKFYKNFQKNISRQKFLGRHNEILRIRKQQSNINATIGRLSSLLPALLEMKKLEAKMKLGKYYSALKIIQLIRHEHLENCRQVGRKITPGNQGPHF